jgi:TolB protein
MSPIRSIVSSTVAAVLYTCLLSCSSSTSSGTATTTNLFSGTISYAAFGSDNYTHVYLLASDGTSTQLTSGAQNDETPEWSFDGSRIVFQRSDSTGIGVYSMNADGSGLTRLSPTPGQDLLPAFSPDGTQIVFTYVVSPNGCNGGSMPLTNIMVMNTDGSNRTTLIDGTVAATCFNVEPRFAPNALTIAYMCGPNNGSVQVCTINPDGSGNTFLTTTSNTVSGDPHWNWDSQQIAISRRDSSGNVNVWTLNADGSNLTQITQFVEPMEGGDAGWSLDNSQLVFEGDTGGMGQSVPNATAGISIVPASGGSPTSLNVPCSDIGCAPRFKP